MNSNKKWDLSQLKNAATFRTAEHRAWINCFNISLTTTAVLLIALFKAGGFPNKVPGIIICSFGLIASIVLLYIQSRALITVKGHEKTIREIENALSLNDSTKNIQKAPTVGARPLMQLIGLSQIVAWSIGIILFALCC